MNLNAAFRRINRLAGVGLYAPTRAEMRREAKAAFFDGDPWMVAQAIHNVGHMARRFRQVDWSLVRAARAAAGRKGGQQVRAALYDMEGDIGHMLAHRRFLGERDLDREFGDG
jgi:hypothetical protein